MTLQDRDLTQLQAQLSSLRAAHAELGAAEAQARTQLAAAQRDAAATERRLADAEGKLAAAQRAQHEVQRQLEQSRHDAQVSVARPAQAHAGVPLFAIRNSACQVASHGPRRENPGRHVPLNTTFRPRSALLRGSQVANQAASEGERKAREGEAAAREAQRARREAERALAELQAQAAGQEKLAHTVHETAQAVADVSAPAHPTRLAAAAPLAAHFLIAVPQGV